MLCRFLFQNKTEDKKTRSAKMKTEDVIMEAKANPIWDEAEGLNLNPEGIVEKISTKFSRYSDSACVNLAIAEIKKYLKESSAQFDTISGMILGATDVFGKKAPLTYPCISKDGKTIVKISTWEKNMLKTPARVTVSGEFSTQYGNLIIDTVDEQEVIDAAGLAAKLAKVAHTPQDEALEYLQQYSSVIMRGKIKYVRPSTRWVNGETDGAWSTWEKTEGKNGVFQPVIDLSLDPGETNTYVTLQIKRQHSANPVINVEDLALLCEDAAKDYPDQPKKQGEAIGAALKDREVVALGSVQSVSRKWNDKVDDYVTSLNISVCFIEELPANSPQRPLTTLEGVGENVPKVKPNMKKGREVVDEPAAEHAPAQATAEKPKKSRAEKVKEAGLEQNAQVTPPIGEKSQESQEESDVKNSANLSKVSPDFKQTVQDIVALCKITKRAPMSFSEKELQETFKLKMGEITIKACKAKARDILAMDQDERVNPKEEASE